MKGRLLTIGLVIWVAATAALRLWGELLLRPRGWVSTLALYVLSFVAMATLARRLCRKAGLPREEWPAGAISLALPTLVLDPFSAAFFPAVFPKIDAQMAGVFGGWMLICCAGALLGVLPLRPERA